MVFLQLTMIMVVLNDRNGSTHGHSHTELESSTTKNSRQKDRVSHTFATSLLPPVKTVTVNPTNIKTKPHEVDMENDFHPYVDFKFVWPEITPDLPSNDYFLIALVNSAASGAKYRARRDGIRKTWANKDFCENKKTDKKWVVLFSLGKVYDAKEDGLIIEEAKKYNDILVGDFKDFYLNNVIKTFMSQLWAHSMNPKYILKSDDDVYIRLPSVINWLVSKNLPNKYYGGAPYYNFDVDRNPNGKWAISKRYFNESKFPPFNAGAFNVISVDLLPKLFNYVRKRRPFHTDDAYIGIAARDLGIDVVRIDGLLLEDSMPQGVHGYGVCRLYNARGFGHSLEPNLMQMLYQKYESMCSNTPQC